MASSLVDRFRVKPGKLADLARRDPGERLGYSGKQAGRAALQPLLVQLNELHDRLWAEATRSVLLVLQGMDASGKDGTIRHVLTSVNPQGLRVVSFRAPEDGELDHDYLWRVHRECPARGHIGAFNRSHYEDVVAAMLIGAVDQSRCELRYQHLREFERMLVDEGTTVVKVFLHLSREEQRQRLQARLDDPTKRWKFKASDLDARRRWDEYQAAYERAITETSTDWAPWYVVPADHKWARDIGVAAILVETVRALDPQFPPAARAVADLVIE